MRKFLVVALGLTIAFSVSSSTANAAIADLRIGEVNILEDLDYESGYNLDIEYDGNNDPISGTLQEDSILYGMWKIQSYIYENGDEAGATSPWFTIAFAAKVDNIYTATTGSGTTLQDWDAVDYVPVTDDEWNTIFDTTTYTQLNRSSSGTMAMFFSDPDGIDADAGSGIKDALGTVDGTPLVEVGFAGGDGEFWTSYSGHLQIFPTPPTDLKYAAALNVTYDYGNGLILAPHDEFNGNLFNPIWIGKSGVFSDVQLAGAIGEHTDLGYFQAPTETDVAIKPVPEPNTMLIWGSLSALGLVFARRRRNAA